jgi:hypothetical protein
VRTFTFIYIFSAGDQTQGCVASSQLSNTYLQHCCEDQK